MTELDFSFDLFQEENMYISVTKSKVVKGNVKIFMSRENRKGNLAETFLMSLAITFL